MFFLYFFFCYYDYVLFFFFFFQAEDGIRDYKVTGVQTCALPILAAIFLHSETPPHTRASVCRICAAPLSRISLKCQRPVPISPVATVTRVSFARRAWLSISSGKNGSSIQYGS